MYSKCLWTNHFSLCVSSFHSSSKIPLYNSQKSVRIVKVWITDEKINKAHQMQPNFIKTKLKDIAWNPPNSTVHDLKIMFLNGAKLAVQFHSDLLCVYTTKQNQQCLYGHLGKGSFPTYGWWKKMYFSDLNQVMVLVQKFKYGKLYPLIYLRIYQQEWKTF